MQSADLNLMGLQLASFMVKDNMLLKKTVGSQLFGFLSSVHKMSKVKK